MSDSGPEVDVSDLRTFDVPDPVKVRGGRLAALGIMALGLVAAWTVLDSTAADHYIGVYQNRGEYSRQRNIARGYVADLPIESVSAKVLAIQDPEIRGAFHEVLAASGDPAQAAAIGAFLDELLDGYPGYWERRIATAACESLGVFPPDVAAPILFQAHAKSKDEMSEAIGGAIASLPPEVVLPAVLAIEDPAARGRWHTVLASSGDPAQIDAIVAFVASESAGANRRFEAEAKSLLAFGEKGTDRLKAALQHEKKAVVNLAAEALREVNLPFLIAYTREELDAFTKMVTGRGGLRVAHEIRSAFKTQRAEMASGKRKLTDVTITPKQNEAAEKLLAAGNARSLRCFQMLKALGPVRNNQEVDFCFIQGLSSFDRSVAEHCARAVDERLTDEQLIDALFQFIAKKSEFSVPEVRIYEQMLERTGAKGAARIAVNLERLLEKAGKPETVFWIYKVLAIRVLKVTGTNAQLPTLAKYAKDTEGYQRTNTDRRTGRVERIQVLYADEIAKTVAAIQKRGK